jgi:hypothetical protein
VSSTLIASFGGQAVSQTNGAPADEANVPVRQRVHPEHEAAGIYRDGLFYYPNVMVGVLFDSNVFASHSAPADDLALLVTPSLLVRSEGESARHELQLSARHYEFERFDSENRTEGSARLTSSRQISSDIKFDSAFEAAHRFEQRGDSLTATSSKSPIAYNDLRAEGSLTKTFNRLGVTVGAGVRSLTYEDGETAAGAILDQSYRNGTIITASVRPFYEFSPGYRAFLRFESYWRDYAGTGALDRDSNGFIARSGLEFQLTSMLFGSIEAGYLEQHYSNPLIPDAEGLSGLGRVTWLMTPLMTVSLFASRSVADIAAQDQEARIDLSAGTRIDYEPLRDLIATVETSFTQEDFTGTSRQDDVLKIQSQIDYFLNPYIQFGVRYIYDSRQSNISDFSFDRHRFTVNVTAQY